MAKQVSSKTNPQSFKLSPQMAEFRLQGVQELHNRLLHMIGRSERAGEKRPNLEAAAEALEEEIYELSMFIEASRS